MHIMLMKILSYLYCAFYGKSTVTFIINYNDGRLI